jgi:hypothetical protein
MIRLGSIVDRSSVMISAYTSVCACGCNMDLCDFSAEIMGRVRYEVKEGRTHIVCRREPRRFRGRCTRLSV